MGISAKKLRFLRLRKKGRNDLLWKDVITGIFTKNVFAEKFSNE